MPHTLKCHVCSRELSVSDKMFEERISGKKVSVRCRNCNAPLTKEDAGQVGTATSDCVEVMSSVGQASPDGKHTQGTVRTASHFTAAKPATPQRKANPSTATQPAVAIPVTTANVAQPPKPSVAAARTTSTTPSLAAVTVPPRPRPEESPLVHCSSATQAAVPRPASVSSPELPVHPTDLDDIPEISVVTPLPSEPPSPAEPVAPMPILRVGVDAATEESPVAAALTPAQPSTAAVSSASAEPSPSPAGSPSSVESRHSDHELTPPAMTLAPDSELLRLSQPEMSVLAPTLFSKQKGTRWMMLGSASALLVVALTIGLGAFRRVPPSENAKVAPPSTVIRTVTPPNGTSMPAAVEAPADVVAAPAMPTAKVVPAPPSEQTAPAALPSSLAAPDPTTASTTSNEAIPDYVSKNTLVLVTDVAFRRAQRCHPLGHAAGTSRVFITLAPSGHVSDARIEGEPLASAPVASCILGHARAIQIPLFEGAPFTYVRSITMR